LICKRNGKLLNQLYNLNLLTSIMFYNNNSIRLFELTADFGNESRNLNNIETEM
jgi:hypothetical protein